jgi:hypothetical protein
MGTRVAAMPSGPGQQYDFFLSRRGAVAAMAQQVTDVLTEKGYSVFAVIPPTPPKPPSSASFRP